jgi:sodium-dependent dicarboxylate transporter 2/3/5
MSQPDVAPPDDESQEPTPLPGWVLVLARPVGPCVALAVFWALSSQTQLPYEACATAGVATLVAMWWMTEAVPLPVTALLPLALFPLLGVYPDRATAMKRAAAPYADPSIFLFFGGFLLALAIEKWGLHRRFALLTLAVVGTRPAAILAGFLAATAFISMWISNTATTLMMLPIALSIVQLVESHSARRDSGTTEDGRRFSTSLLLAVAYAASIGGCMTLIGTPPNVAFRGFVVREGMTIDFGRWMLFATPLAIVYLVLCWVLFTRWMFPVRLREVAGGAEFVQAQLRKLGPVSRGEMLVLLVFATTATAWIFHQPLAAWGEAHGWTWLTRFDDPTIAMLAGVALFLIPVNSSFNEFLLDWQTASKIPWGVLLIFGGGLSLAAAIEETRLAAFLGAQLVVLGGMPTPLLLAFLCLGIIFFSELTSNLATVVTLMPIVHTLAIELDMDPLLLLTPCALSASYAFMLPAGTPPNAIAYGTGRVTMREMMRAGFLLNLAGGLLIPLAMYTLGRWLLGVRI